MDGRYRAPCSRQSLSVSPSDFEDFLLGMSGARSDTLRPDRLMMDRDV